MQMNQLLSASKYINYNRLATSHYSSIKKISFLMKGMLEVLSCCSFYNTTASTVECNICGWQGKRFVNFHTGYNHVYENSVCPECFSHPRHRSYSVALREILSGIDEVKTVLHFAPERHIYNVLKSFKNVDYLSVDIDHKKAMRKEDIQSLSFKDNSFDIIICIHVFEHIENDQLAMQEVFRVLKPGGIALLDVPLDSTRELTYEDTSITTPEARTKAFWQWDHVRLYGRDYPEKLRSVGFHVRELNVVENRGVEYIQRYGLEVAPNFLCSKL